MNSCRAAILVVALTIIGGLVGVTLADPPGGSTYCCWYVYSPSASIPSGCYTGNTLFRSGPWTAQPQHQWCEPEQVVDLPGCYAVFTFYSLSNCSEP